MPDLWCIGHTTREDFLWINDDLLCVRNLVATKQVTDEQVICKLGRCSTSTKTEPTIVATIGNRIQLVHLHDDLPDVRT